MMKMIGKLGDSDLLPYQVIGKNRILHQDVIYLGDDPGLGKTAQVIRACAAMHPKVLKRGVVIICPASLRVNWANEWIKWGGPDWCELHIISYQEAVNDCLGKSPRKNKEPIGLLKKNWGMVAFDEAHALKTSGGATQRAKSGLIFNRWKEKTEDPDEPDRWFQVDGIAANKTVMMSGTPVLNKPIDIFPMIRHLDNRTWSSKTKFEARYCNGHMGDWGWDATGASNLGELKQKLVGSKLLLRRLKKDVLKELPAKRRQLLHVAGSNKDSKRCESLMQAAMQGKILSDSLNDIEQEVEEYEVIEKFMEHVASVRRDLGMAKLKPTLDYIKEQDTLGVLPPKLVVFAHHRELIEELTEGLNKVGIKADKYYGGMSDAVKNNVVNDFMKGDLQVFVGSIIAAGVGLTLTAADTCLIIEPSYVPAENIQAEDRIHRIGAQKPVLIQYVTLDKTLDSRIMSIIVSKMQMIEQLMS
jgi:SNF2 family DNA or RNA helicase